MGGTRIAYHLGMIFRRYGTFTGGIDLPDDKRPTLDKPIAVWGPIERLRVPLAPCGGTPAESVVEVARHVQAGERIARSAGGGVDIFAPLSGRVAALSWAQVAAGACLAACPAIELSDLSQMEGIAPVEEREDPREESPQALRDRIAEGSLMTCHPRPAALAQWVAKAHSKRCRVLIANVMENQPMVTANHRLLVEYGGEVVRGLAILGRAIEVGELILAVDERRTGDYRRLVQPTRRHHVKRIALSHKYPTGAEAILAKILTRREVPPGRSLLEIGVGVVDAATCLAVYRWVAAGIRQTARVVTVAGRVERPGNYYVPFGTDCMAMTGGADVPIIHGGPMVGLRCGDQGVVGPATDAVLAVETCRFAAPGPCIRCGWCTDHCPARLNVAALNDDFELNLVERAHQAGALACVECGVCSYVCPARLPLSQRIKQLKQAIGLLRKRMPLFASG